MWWLPSSSNPCVDLDCQAVFQSKISGADNSPELEPAAWYYRSLWKVVDRQRSNPDTSGARFARQSPSKLWICRADVVQVRKSAWSFKSMMTYHQESIRPDLDPPKCYDRKNHRVSRPAKGQIYYLMNEVCNLYLSTDPVTQEDICPPSSISPPIFYCFPIWKRQ